MYFQFLTFFSSRFLFFRFDEQINELLVVKFEETGTNQILLILACSFDMLENEIYCSRHYSSKVFRTLFSLHCKCFSSSRLTIGKYCSIVTLHHTLDDRQGRKLKHTLLLRCLTISSVECKVSYGTLTTYTFSRIVTFFRSRILNRNRVSDLIDCDTIESIIVNLVRTHGSAPDSHFNCLTLCRHFEKISEFKQ